MKVRKWFAITQTDRQTHTHTRFCVEQSEEQHCCDVYYLKNIFQLNFENIQTPSILSFNAKTAHYED